MLIEHEVPFQADEAAHQLHMDHTILSMLPSSITVFNLGGCVRMHTAWSQEQGHPYHKDLRLACRVLGTIRLVFREIVCCLYNFGTFWLHPNRVKASMGDPRKDVAFVCARHEGSDPLLLRGQKCQASLLSFQPLLYFSRGGDHELLHLVKECANCPV